MTWQDIQQLKNIAIVNAQVAETLCALEGMKVTNAERERAGSAPAYGEEAFEKLRQEVCWNTIAEVLRRGL